MRARVLFDTSVFVTASIEGIARLSPSARSIVEDPETDRLLSALSYSEIAIKAGIGKLRMTVDGAREAAAYLRLTLLAFKPQHAERLFTLPVYKDHRDPFDRMLIATALVENLPIVSLDRTFQRYEGLKIIR